MASPSDRRYLKSHEWARQDGGKIVIGISRFAVDELTDITFVDLPPVGRQIAAGDPFGEIESVKATSELFAPVSGKVIAVNEKLADDPGLINADPWDAGWLIAVAPANPAELDGLMSAEDYDKQIEAEH